ncbi:MAG: hypothetical protein DHS20C18_44750 [Saprospiraceae bacterium]|nr:MAG: hypothetical protein DHS20C18_44750 [Saprospiraceae bacterium]
MLVKDFFQTLSNHPGKELQFEYRKNQFVPPAYHITEVKNVHIESVDCGGRPSEEFLTIVQLWIDGIEQSDRNMLTEKAQKIFNLVDAKKPIRSGTQILFEWGDKETPVSNYAIDRIEEQEDRLVVKLSVPPTACKPRLELLQAHPEAANTSCCA